MGANDVNELLGASMRKRAAKMGINMDFIVFIFLVNLSPFLLPKSHTHKPECFKKAGASWGEFCLFTEPLNKQGFVSVK